MIFGSAAIDIENNRICYSNHIRF